MSSIQESFPSAATFDEVKPEGYIYPASSKYDFRYGSGGNSIWLHMERLAEFARKAPNGVIVEVGVGCCDGSTHAFDLGLQASAVPKENRLHIGIDIHPEANPEWAPTSEWWQYVCASSQEESSVDEVRNRLIFAHSHGDLFYQYPDILYIDTVHEKPFLARELEIWPALCGPKTIYLFHDTWLGGSYNPMTDAIKEFAKEGKVRDTHFYVDLSTDCSGLGALLPR